MKVFRTLFVAITTKGQTKILTLNFIKMKTITEKNKLIAEFMGLGKAEPYYIEDENNQETNLVFSTGLKYNTDWNWLMEVVKKIEKTTIRETHGQFNENECESTISISIENTFCQILSNGAFLNEIISINGESKIEAVYSACVEFVKWYNENK